MNDGLIALMNTSSGDQTSPCAIIAGYLKFKVLRIKGGKDAGPSSSPSTQDVSVPDTVHMYNDYWQPVSVHTSSIPPPVHTHTHTAQGGKTILVRVSCSKQYNEGGRVL